MSMASSSSSSSSCSGRSALLQFQLGLFREVVRVPPEQASYHQAKRLAVEIIERKVGSPPGLSGSDVRTAARTTRTEVGSLGLQLVAQHLKPAQ